LFVFVEYSIKKWQHQRKLDRAVHAAAKSPETQVASTTQGSFVVPLAWTGKELTGVNQEQPIEVTEFDVYSTPSPKMQYVWTVFAKVLEKIRDRVVQRGSRLLVLYEVDLPSARGKATKGILARTSQPLDLDAPARNLKEICAALDIHFVDTSDAFRQRKPVEAFFLKRNLHWNKTGHHLAAELVAKRIASQR